MSIGKFYVRNLESTNLSRDNLSREIGHRPDQNDHAIFKY